MRGYKFLVMQSNPNNNVMFLSSDLDGGSGRCANVDTNVTHFKPHDFGGGHQNNDYWNSAEDLLVGFSRWYLRTTEKTAYNMGNRLYSATNTYRFFRVDEDLDTHDIEQVDLANNDLISFEIKEEEFIGNMFNSWCFENIVCLFPPTTFSTTRTEPSPVEVDVVYNKETNTWCWISDYLNYRNEQHLYVDLLDIPVGLGYKEAVQYISKVLDSEYRFGGNDSYNKKQLTK
jgi:hypothetical protein